MRDANARFGGKVAVVTGAGSGIGEALARGFARERAKVAVVDIAEDAAKRVAREIEADGGRAVAVRTDVAQPSQIRAMVDAVVGEFGRIDVLVNNAAIRCIRPFLEHTDEEWQRTLDVDLSGAFYASRAVIPQMLRVGKGKIVNVASIAGLIGRPNRVAYCAAKAGLIALTQAAAADMAGKNIYINALAPGSIATTLNAEYAETPEGGAAWARETIVGRWGRPAEVAEAGLFLASDASDYINGTVLRIDGGWLAFKSRGNGE